jgi:hypothetical protein
MKKLMLVMVAVVFSLTVTAQDDGSWVIEVNTGSWATGSTAFSLTSADGNTAWSAGGEAGYFVKENLAIKAGLGYSDLGGDGIFTYKVGAKYYLGDQFPVGVDFTGTSVDGNSASWVGLQGGYAIQVANNIAIEPTLRYNLTLDDMKADSAFQALVGFAIFL